MAEAEANAVRAEYETVKTVYEEAKSALENDIMAFTNSCETEEWTEETIEALKSLSVTISNDYKAIHEAEAALEQKQTTFSNAETKLKQAKQTLEQAESEYKKNTQEAESKLEELNNNIGSLQSAYEEAVNNSLTEKVGLQNDYDTAALNGEYASTVYDNNVTTLEEAVTEAKKNLEELQKEQEEILALEDGVIRAAQDGTIATVTYEVGNILNTDALVTYCDTSVLTISVEVSQEDIAKIAVCDTVAVSVSGSRKGNLEGSISSIASSATTGGSISNVTYAVVITIDNADGRISSSVTFLTEKEMETESNAETETSLETNEMKETLDLNE